ncbi:MAG: serine/threonine protein kinase, partial [Planctomycetes bacterium]|nr:serine/threonine protein kinase [Planctomycetota bacterium]
LAEIARGGMGVVFRARQVSLNREVAVKMILAGALASATDVQRFQLEAEAAANLDHPNVLPIYEVSEFQGQPYFSMKLVEGGSLAALLASGEKPPLRDLVRLLVKVCRAVHFAHQRGVLHRDLKPANVLLGNDGEPFVTDFGLAKKTGQEDSGLTRTGMIVGTPSYMAPEQARGDKQLSTATDVYSLGAILYEILTGRPPFREATVLGTLRQVLEQDPPNVRTIHPEADRDLALVAGKCLAKAPEARYESAAALADELERWLNGEPLTVRPLSLAAQAWRWLRRHTAAAAATLVLGIGWGVAGGLLLAMMAGRPDAALLPLNANRLFPLWWAELGRDSPPARQTAVAVTLTLVLTMGWLVRATVRPASAREALGYAVVVGLIATLVAFLFLGPVLAVTPNVQLHPIEEDFWGTYLIERPYVPASQIEPSDLPYLRQFLPPEKRKPNYPGWGTDLLVLRANARYTNQLYAAALGIWVGLVASSILFLGVGLVSTAAVDYLCRSGRGLIGRVLGYLELHVPAVALLFWSVGFVVTWIWSLPWGLKTEVLKYARFEVGEVLLVLLVLLATTGVIRRWHPVLRAAGYVAWAGLAAGVYYWMTRPL